MKITEFARRVSKIEGLKEELSIAQIAEVLRVSNRVSKGEIYRAIRKQNEEDADA